MEIDVWPKLLSQVIDMKAAGIKRRDIIDSINMRVIQAAHDIFELFFKTKRQKLSSSQCFVLFVAHDILCRYGKLIYVNKNSELILSDIDNEIVGWEWPEFTNQKPTSHLTKRKCIWIINKFCEIQEANEPFVIK